MKRALTGAEVVLVFPAGLFFASLFLRNFLPSNDAANGPQHIVRWYAGHQWTLWILLIALPLSALVAGSATLLQRWNDDASLREDARRVLVTIRARLDIAITGIATLGAGFALLLVALHMAAN